MRQITLSQARVLAYLHSWGRKYQGEAFEIKVKWVSQDLGYGNHRTVYLILKRLIDVGAVEWIRGDRACNPLVRVRAREEEFEIVARQDVRTGRAIA